MLDRRNFLIAGGTAAATAALDDADDAGPADAGDHLVKAEAAELLGDGRGGAVDVVHDLGMAVDVVAPRSDLVVEIGETIDDGHKHSGTGRAACIATVCVQCKNASSYLSARGCMDGVPE